MAKHSLFGDIINIRHEISIKEEMSPHKEQQRINNFSMYAWNSVACSYTNTRDNPFHIEY